MIYKLEQVIGENTRQILLVRREIIVPPIPILPVVTSDPVLLPGSHDTTTQQMIINNTVQLPVDAIKIKEIQASISGVSSQRTTGGILVDGEIAKMVIFVDTDNIVRSQNEQIPFSILVNGPALPAGASIDATVTVEDIIFSLNSAGNAVNQTIVLKATVDAKDSSVQYTVVTDVSGPEVLVNKILVEGWIVTSSGPVFQEFEAVTDVSGPHIGEVTKQVLMLQKVGELNPGPITVVTAVQIS
jgi:hypothetical protein